MKEKFEYGTYQYEYFIEFGDRKTLTLVVQPDLRIIVRVPNNTTLSDIEVFLTRKWRWLEKRLDEFRKYRKTHREKQYVSGEAFNYLGRQYTLEVSPSVEDTVKLERGKLRIYTTKDLRDSAHNKGLIESWYALRRHVVFKQEYYRALKLFDYIDKPHLRERIMARRWGSYAEDGKISLNPKLIQTPREAIFYICVHELCHINNKKHDEKFYNELEKRLPNWREIKERLEIRYG
jgi:predicted metal-dependent hydrolase